MVRSTQNEQMFIQVNYTHCVISTYGCLGDLEGNLGALRVLDPVPDPLDPLELDGLEQLDYTHLAFYRNSWCCNADLHRAVAAKKHSDAPYYKEDYFSLTMVKFSYMFIYQNSDYSNSMTLLLFYILLYYIPCLPAYLHAEP